MLQIVSCHRLVFFQISEAVFSSAQLKVQDLLMYKKGACSLFIDLTNTTAIKFTSSFSQWLPSQLQVHDEF